ncbi:hypothetical protein IW261DRAFT_1452101 [Armillaria novae-zelandiae]|uniref:C2H2-type domain-containing protein n=1 Tax=Armillaria novae-zelandiae TaxID=153914 RepID=A0AA39PK67_9AGAR|nr:hypothetical protein IW261DRAFT_1452101 [Armillaria novae-zelandiae]
MIGDAEFRRVAVHGLCSRSAKGLLPFPLPTPPTVNLLSFQHRSVCILASTDASTSISGSLSGLFRALNLIGMSAETTSGVRGTPIPAWTLPMTPPASTSASEPSHPPRIQKHHLQQHAAAIALDAISRQQYPDGPATEPDGPRTYTYIAAPNSVAFAPDDAHPSDLPEKDPEVSSSRPGRSSQSPEASSSQGGVGANHYPSASGVPRLPPILQVEKQQVTTSATQLASANRRRNEAHFQCPVPGCGSTFTRRFNLRGHLRSHTEERPYHDCKRHQALHTAKAQANVCQGCKKTFSRLDALNVLRSDGGAECRRIHDAKRASNEEAMVA